jgi:hypothetical protein
MVTESFISGRRVSGTSEWKDSSEQIANPSEYSSGSEVSLDHIDYKKPIDMRQKSESFESFHSANVLVFIFTTRAAMLSPQVRLQL